ncbi:MAG: hypothetical protein DHS20C18_37660 [Saprospiraceae bacterium]|nr:MAG: hypothetical protein DHS20C18_37660 [Saprospiraceae bacterium]
MKYCYLLSLLFLWCSFSHASDPSRGYLITKNGKKLTGVIGEIYHSQYGSQVIFINDFGNTYSIHSALVRGFALQKGSEVVFYESRYLRKRWQFLLVVYKGEELSLYKGSEPEYQEIGPLSFIHYYQEEPTQFWVENQSFRMSKVARIGFRRKMRKLLSVQAPKLASKIGKPGYRFSNLLEIVDEFNKICRKNEKLL